MLTISTPTLSQSLLISVLMKTVYIEVYGEKGVTSELANFIQVRFSPEKIASIINENPDGFLIAYQDGNPIGAVEIHFDSTCRARNIPIPEIDKLYVLKRFNGQGVGQALMKKAEQVVLEKEYTELHLEVYVENHRAVAFYKKMGYEVIGEVDFPMQENTYLNLVMTKQLGID